MAPLPWTTNEMCKATHGKLLCGSMDKGFKTISIDSRDLSPEAMFVAIKGDTHDGHDFIKGVVKGGGTGVIAEHQRAKHLLSQKWWRNDTVLLGVDDTTASLGRLAAFNRKRTHIKVAAITGSNGKTTTRKLMYGVTRQAFNTLCTKGNLNNHIGLPLTLFRLEMAHQLAVLELGMNHKGEIKNLSGICSPDIGVITNVGPAHLEGLGSMEAIAAAKGEILEKIKPGGTAVLNADDDRVRALAGKAAGPVLFFGESGNADVRAKRIHQEMDGIFFTLVLPSETVEIKLKGQGIFLVYNALAAASVGFLLGISTNLIKKGLESFSPVKGRMNLMTTDTGIIIIDDTYNANPDSMKAAIHALCRMKKTGKQILVAGDMLELGDFSPSLHKGIGKEAAASGVDRVYATGNFSEQVVNGAGDHGMDASDLFAGTKKQILQHLTGTLEPGDIVLVKGSRGMTMEEVVNELFVWGKESGLKSAQDNKK